MRLILYQLIVDRRTCRKQETIAVYVNDNCGEDGLIDMLDKVNLNPHAQFKAASSIACICTATKGSLSYSS